MRIPACVTAQIAKLKGFKHFGIAAKAVGVVGVGAAVYDAHHWGKLTAFDRKNTKNADAGLDYFNNTQYLDNRSHLTSKMKQGLFNCELANTLRGSWNSTVGYLGGFCSGVGRHIIPLAASVGAIVMGGKKGLFAAGALGLWGLGSSIKHTCSHFNHKP